MRMKNRFPLFIAVTAMILTTFLVVSPVSAQVADGTYEVNYEMKEDGTANTSIADGYFVKPANVTVENGTYHVQFTVTGSNYIKSLTVPGSSIEIVSDDTENETRTYRFTANDLSQPLDMDMNIIVPDMYDMTHTAQAVFDVSGLPEAEAGATAEQESEENNDTEEAAAAGETVENPPTGDSSSIGLYALLMLGSGAALFAIWKLRPARN
jgi:heme-binding NEAT domain protein